MPPTRSLRRRGRGSTPACATRSSGRTASRSALRANVINLFDANYWVATTSFFVQNQPRTFMLSLTADF